MKGFVLILESWSWELNNWRKYSTLKCTNFHSSYNVVGLGARVKIYGDIYILFFGKRAKIPKFFS